MGAMIAIPTGRPFTVADLEAMPDDGNRYELIDGMLIVSPAPSWGHQEMGFAAGIALRNACPRDPTEPGSLTAYELTDRGYRRLAHVVGDDAFDAELPFPVRIVPARLPDGLRP